MMKDLNAVSPGQMSEVTLRQEIFMASSMDWWLINTNEGVLYLGSYLCSALHLPLREIPIESVKKLLHIENGISLENEYKKLCSGEIHYIRVKFGNRYEISVHVTKRSVTTDNCVLMGYARVVNEEDDSVSETAQKASLYLSNMSHDLRTPLNAIVGFSRLLAETDSAEERQEFLRIIVENNDMLLHLIDDILDLSKIESGMLDVSYSSFNIDEFMADIYQAAKIRSTSPNVSLILKKESVSTEIVTDKNRLAQVINNLINNAIKFTKEGDVEIEYSYNGKILNVKIKDTGIGIPYDKINKIFDRFVRLGTDVKGTGLGLAISSSIVKLLGGKIGADSKEGKGSTFWLTIPTKSDAIIKNVDINASPNGLSLADAQVINKPLVLVAEDDESNYKLCEVLLKKKYRLIHAWNGNEAVEMFKQYNPDIILMDINMPQKNGYEASSEIRKLSWTVPIVAVTAYALAEDEQKILQSGFDDYLSKPLEISKLNTTVVKQLQSHKKQ